ncbi:rRNA methyltransferase [Capnocytophaga stomatis]|uniref:rRNA methyltransferase n=1 Tax=Capnocytophaga stomatis TaxID=1848904 RepID=A0A250FUS1_9FLAO|nr:RNA methyltransferase [Capnocytophaga stomatis]ATA88860.1 rRNA methyltransferase [Capnocytophaga stomatis]GIJ94557.1 rRNA methyltransferase [Capnocytophaga stomatis]
MKEITSVQNPFIKQLILLREKSRNRKKEGVFVIEGEREIQLAIQGNYVLETILFQKEIFPEEKVKRLLSKGNKEVQTICISKEVYEKLTYRSSTEGIIAVAKSKSHLLKDVEFKDNNPLILVAEAPEKPGNIGALLRTADAAGIDAVLIANPKTDLYNPNIIRSSVGCVFTTSVAMGTTAEIISFLKQKNIKIFCAALSASKPYTEILFKEASAIVVGTEDEGLTDEWLQNSHQNIIIPMEGVIDSMNVSVAAAVLIFEAKRQRKK